MNCRPLSNCVLLCFVGSGVFWRTLASAKRVSELQASFELCPSLLRRFWSFLAYSVFAAGLHDELLLCPVRTLSESVVKMSRFVNRPRRLFVLSCSSSRAMSNNGFSYLLQEVLVHSGASSNDVAAPNAHSIRGIATSSSFFRNWSLASVLEASSWRSNTVFTSFLFKRCLVHL